MTLIITVNKCGLLLLVVWLCCLLGSCRHARDAVPTIESEEKTENDQSFYFRSMALVDLDVPSGFEPDAAFKGRYRLFTNNAEPLSRLLPACYPKGQFRPENNAVLISVAQGRCHSQRKKPRHHLSSFLIDWEDPIFEKIASKIRRNHPPDPTLAELTDFTHQYITNKQISMELSIASKVAVKRAGDCKAHATLLAALTRKFKYPSRIVFGYVLVQTVGGKWQAYGHTWVEAHNREGNWVGIDGTMVRPAVDKLYIPLYELTDEGPSFSRQVFNFVNYNIYRIEIELAGTQE
jgi:transglutaminase-like putative cysteine protease